MENNNKVTDKQYKKAVNFFFPISGHNSFQAVCCFGNSVTNTMFGSYLEPGETVVQAFIRLYSWVSDPDYKTKAERYFEREKNMKPKKFGETDYDIHARGWYE